MAVRRIYGATGLTGGGIGALSSINSTDLKYGDLAIAQADTIGGPDHGSEFDAIYFYRYASVTTLQNVPTVIKPVNLTDGQTGRWLLISPAWFMEDLTVEAGASVVTNQVIGNTLDLSLGYNDGSIYITIGDNLVTVEAPTTFTGQITSTVLAGTAPFVIPDTTTVSENLNAFYIGNLGGGKATYEEVVITDGTHLFTGVPGVVNVAGVPSVTPTQQYHLATVQYVDDLHDTPDEISHADLENLVWSNEPTNTIVADDHTQYPRVDGVRGFTGEVAGIDPTVSTSLATANYVTTSIGTHNNNAVAHPILMTVDGSDREFTSQPPAVDATVDPVTIYALGTSRWLATKGYVDDELAGAGVGDIDTTYVRLDAGNTISGRIYTSNLTPNTTIGVSGGTAAGEYMTRADLDNAITIALLNTDAYARLDAAPMTYNIVKRDVPESANTFTPTTDYHLVTKLWATDGSLGVLLEHGDLNSLTGSDHHTQYMLNDGTREFTGVVSYSLAVDPVLDITLNAHIATKGYVDNAILNDTSGVTSLNGQTGALDIYDTAVGVIKAMSAEPTTANTPFLEMPYVTNNAISPSIAPTQPWDLVTLEYVNDALAGGITLTEYVNIYGTNTIIANQQYRPNIYQDYFVVNQSISQSRDSDLAGRELVHKEYVDNKIAKCLTSATDGEFDYLVNKIIPEPTYLSGGVTTVNPTVDITNVNYNNGSLERFHIRHGGAGFIAPQTLGVPTTFAAYGADGVLAPTVTESTITVPVSDTNPGLGDAKWDIYRVYGDVEYIEIVAAGTGYVVGEVITIGGDGQDAKWEITAVGGLGEITAVARYDYGLGTEGVASQPYTFVNAVTILTTSGINASLRAVVAGEVVTLLDDLIGDGYTSTTYTYKGAGAAGGPVNEGYVFVGAGDTNLLDIDFLNPIDERLELSVQMVDTSAGGNPYTFRVDNGSLQLVQNGVTSQVGGKFIWTLNTTSFETAYNEGNFADATVGVITVTLPDSGIVAPVLGDVFIVDDYKSNSSVNNITVQPHANDGGNLLVAGSSATPFIIDVDGSRVEFTYVDGTYGWRYKVI